MKNLKFDYEIFLQIHNTQRHPEANFQNFLNLEL
jgi:hypothetical protein